MSEINKYVPVIKAEDYKNIDGRNAYESIVKSISIGMTSQEKDGIMLQLENTDESMTLIPLHRIIDLAIVACKTKEYMQESYHIKDADETGALVSRLGIQGDAMTMKVCGSKKDFLGLSDIFVKNDEMLSERLSNLARLLRDMRYC